MTFISWFSDIGLYLEDYLMYKAVTLAGGIREPLLTCSSYDQTWYTANSKNEKAVILSRFAHSHSCNHCFVLFCFVVF